MLHDLALCVLRLEMISVQTYISNYNRFSSRSKTLTENFSVLFHVWDVDRTIVYMT